MPHQEYLDPKSGKPWLSVTEILNIVSKDFLLYWYGSKGTAFCERVKHEATAFGRQVHTCIEEYINESILPDNTKEGKVAQSAINWMKETGFVPYKQEMHVVHEGLKYHGTFDALGYFKRKKKRFLIMDWKTDNNPSNLYALQLAAYAAAYNYMNKLKPEQEEYVNEGGILRLDKQSASPSAPLYLPFHNLAVHIPTFEAALRLKTYFNDKEYKHD